MKQISRRGVLLGSLTIPMMAIGRMAWADGGEVTISHYFTGELGLKAFNEQVAAFTAATGIVMKDSPVGHEDFKTDILVRAAGNSLPTCSAIGRAHGCSSSSIRTPCIRLTTCGPPTIWMR